MKTYIIIERPVTGELKAILSIHRPGLGLYGKEIGIVHAHDQQRALELAYMRNFDAPEEPMQEPW